MSMTLEMPPATTPTGRIPNRVIARSEAIDRAREAYVTRDIRPTYAELSAECGMTEQRLQQAASDQGWPMARARYIQQRLDESGAGEVILSAMRSSRSIVAAGENCAMLLLGKICEIAESIKPESAASTRCGIVNTLTFAFSNVAKATKDLGIVGFPKELADAGKGGNGHWNPQLLQSINVTIGKLADANKEAPAVGVETRTATVANPESTPDPTAPSVS